MNLAKLAFLVFSLLVFSLLAMPVWADGPQTGTIDGHVRDAQGQGLPGVTVTLKGPQNEQTTATGAGGEYRFGLLPPGRYTVVATLEGLGTDELATTLESGARRAVDW